MAKETLSRGEEAVWAAEYVRARAALTRAGEEEERVVEGAIEAAWEAVVDLGEELGGMLPVGAAAEGPETLMFRAMMRTGRGAPAGGPRGGAAALRRLVAAARALLSATGEIFEDDEEACLAEGLFNPCPQPSLSEEVRSQIRPWVEAPWRALQALVDEQEG